MLLLIVVLVLITSLYFYGRKNFNYWEQRGIKHDEPTVFVGNNARNFFQKASMAMLATEMYRKYPNEKVVGFYRGMKPELVLRDPEIIKRVLATDFNHFYARGFNESDVIEPLLKNVFFADGDLWKMIRQRFSPAFSIAKIKGMFNIITEKAERLQVITEEVCDKEFYDARELMARYTTDFIGACGFGISMDALNDENSEFRKLGRRIFKRTLLDAIKGGLKIVFTEQFKWINFLDAEIEKSVVHLVTTVMKERNYKPAGKNDFVDQLLELRQKGKIVVESIEHKQVDGPVKMVELEVDDMLMIAQVFVFFGAGFETSSTASSYTLHQLAFHPEYQQKVIEEIDRVLPKHGNKITYDSIREMNYLEMVFLEAMRLYPSVGFLVRQCKSDKYTFPELNLTIDKGVKVMIPLQALNVDEKYFKDAFEFIPERFTPENKEKLTQYAYIPFGEGPRQCVGMRLGQMQSMAGLVAVLQKFTVEPAACSERFPTPDPCGVVSEGFKYGLPLKFRRRTEAKTSA